MDYVEGFGNFIWDNHINNRWKYTLESITKKVYEILDNKGPEGLKKYSKWKDKTPWRK